MSALENQEVVNAPPGKRPKRGVPAGLWIRCDACGGTLFRKQVEQSLNVCPECGHHFHVPTAMRLRQLLDPDSFEEWYADMTSGDPLGFADRRSYPDRVREEQARTGLKDACTVGRGYLRGRPLVFGITDPSFIMGSMGSVVGEKLTRAVERATELCLPLVIVSGSGGGARMHEGIVSLMQMGKVSAALALPPCTRIVHFCAHQSDNGRSGRELCIAGRHHRGRTQSDDWFRRTACCGSHLPYETS